MNTADIVARLKLAGAEFSTDLRARFGEFNTVAAAAAQKAAGEFRRIGANILPPAEFQQIFAAGTAAANRMTAAVDPLFAAQQRYNVSLREANELQQLGFLTGARYQQVHAGITAQLEREIAVGQRLNASLGARRAGLQQLSFQVGDIAQQISTGYTPASVIFAQQSGQVVQALQLMGGEGNKFLRFLGGPWGIALSAAAVVLAPFIGRLFDARTELQKATDELVENARKAELTRQAQEIYGQTLPGVTQRIREQTQALIEQNRTMEENQRLRLAGQENEVRAARQNLDGVLEELDSARADLRRITTERDGLLRANDFRTDPGYVNRLNQQIDALRERIVAMQRDEATIRANIARSERGRDEARIPLARSQAERMVDPVRALTDAYAERARQAEIAATATERMTAAQRAAAAEAMRVLPQTLAGIYRERDARVRAEQDRRSAQRTEQRREAREGSEIIRPVARPTWVSPYGADRSNVPLNGRRIPGRRHLGTDLGGAMGASVVAPEAGTAYVRNSPGGLGLYVEIRADSGARDLLGHLSAARVRSGERVAAGQLVGLIGDSGNAAGGSPHLHHSRYDRRGNPVDPSRLYGRGRGGAPSESVAAEQEAQRAAQQAERELEVRNRIVQSAEQETAQAVEQARLGDIRVQGLDAEAALETELSAKRQQAAERLAQLRQGGATDADIEAQQRITSGLQEQLSLYEDQSAAYAQMLDQHRADGEVTAQEAAAERAAAATKQQTLARAQQIGTTIEDNLQIQLAMIRAEQQLTTAVEAGTTARNEQKQAAREMQEEQERALEDMKQDMLRRQEDQVRDLADLYGELFRGQTGNIIDRFKDGMLDAIAQIAAAWTLSQISGQQFNLQGTLQGMQGNPIASLLGGLVGGGKGAAGGMGGAGGLLGFMGGGGTAAGGLGGLGATIGTAVPYIGAALAAFGILKQLGVFSSTKRGSATLGYTGGELGTGATRGNSSDFIAASSSAMDSVGSSLQRIAETLGGTVSGAGSVSLGQRDGNWRGDPTGRGITKTKKGAIDFGDDQEAAIRWAISEALRDGVISGISDAAKRILQSGKDLEKAIEKAVMIEQIPKLLKARMDPVGAALDELEEKWAKVIAALKEGGATAEQMADAQKLYKLELEDTISKTASATASLKEFLDSLKMGSNSPYSLRQQEETARAALQPYLDKIAAGEAINNDQYQAAAQTYLDIERQLYGSTGQFFNAMDEIMAATSQAIARIDSAVPIRTAVDPFVEQTAANTTTMTEQLEIISGFLATIAGGGANDNSLSPSGFIGGGGGFTGQQLD